MPEFYLPYNGTNRKQKEIYLPSSGTNRKQKELYAGSGGANWKIFAAGQFCSINQLASYYEYSDGSGDDAPLTNLSTSDIFKLSWSLPGTGTSTKTVKHIIKAAIQILDFPDFLLEDKTEIIGIAGNIEFASNQRPVKTLHMAISTIRYSEDSQHTWPLSITSGIPANGTFYASGNIRARNLTALQNRPWYLNLLIQTEFYDRNKSSTGSISIPMDTFTWTPTGVPLVLLN